MRTLLLCAAAVCSVAHADDRWLNQNYISLHDSARQRQFRALKPFPVAVVYWQQPEHRTLEQIRQEFRRIRETGFTALRMIILRADVPAQQVYLAALDEGLTPWWFGEGGWEAITPALLNKLGIPGTLAEHAILTHPSMIRYQTERYRERVRHPAPIPPDPMPAVNLRFGRGGFEIPEEWIPYYAHWLERQYGTIPRLHEAWNYDRMLEERGPRPATFLEAARLATKPIRSWEFRRYRDVLRFEADTRADNLRSSLEHRLKHDPGYLRWTGGELDMFRNFALIGTDQELMAEMMTDFGGFSPSIHPQHHFGLTDGEVARPVYFQAQLCVDLFKGGWTGAYESTGFPTVYAGTHGFSGSPGFMRQFLFSYLAAGMRGIGIWTWNQRPAGWESGEYGLTDRQGELTPWGEEAGRIAKAIQRYRFELWDTRNEPLVGIFYSWENLATAARLSLGVYPIQRDEAFALEPMQAFVGAARAFQSHNIPFEFVTERNILDGLAPRYSVIYLPHIVGMTGSVLERLTAYVEQGGRVVADVPTPWWDEYGRVVKSGPGTPFEKIFGATVRVFEHTHNAPQRLGAIDVNGAYALLKLTRAEAAAHFDSGLPAITEAKSGRGSAAYLGMEASIKCLRPGNAAVENLIVNTALRGRRPAWSVTGAVAYRRVAPGADHYFLINDGAAAVAELKAEKEYRELDDAVTGERLGSGKLGRIALEARSGRWVRGSVR